MKTCPVDGYGDEAHHSPHCAICQDAGTCQTNYDPTGICTSYGPCKCEAGRRVLESDNAILKKLVNERTDEIHQLKVDVEYWKRMREHLRQDYLKAIE